MSQLDVILFTHFHVDRKSVKTFRVPLHLQTISIASPYGKVAVSLINVPTFWARGPGDFGGRHTKLHGRAGLGRLEPRRADSTQTRERR
jgi:hypothetical protein